MAKSHSFFKVAPAPVSPTDGPIAPVNNAPAAPGKNRLIATKLPPVVFIAGLFAVLTVALTWRMWGYLTTAVPGGDIDGFENVWNNWWVRTALLDLHTNPLASDYIYYPSGVSLRLHALQPLNGLLTIPLAPLFGPLGATNLTFGWAIFSTALFSYMLFHYLTGQRLPAAAGALFFTFCNHQLFEFLGAGQGNLISLEWLPLYLLFMLKVARNDPRRWLNSALMVLTLGCLVLTDLQYLMFAAMITGLYSLYSLFGKASLTAKMRMWTRLALPGLSYSAIVLPLLLIPAALEATSSPWLWPKADQSLYKALDLFDLTGWNGRNLGYVPLGLAGLGLATGWKRAAEQVRFLAVLAGVFGLFSLGPVLAFDGKPLKLGEATLALPYQWLSRIPGMQVGRNPSLFQIVWLLAVAGLAAFGWRWLLARYARPDSRVALTAAIAACAVGPLLWSGASSYRVDFLEKVPFYEQLGQDSTDYAILEVPLFTYRGRGENVYQGYQVYHRKPRFGGRTSRDHKLDNPNNFVKSNLLFRDFFYLNPSGLPELRAPGRDFLPTPDYRRVGLPLLNFYHVRYIVMYKDALDREAELAAQKLLREIFDDRLPGPVYEDGLLRAYEVPPSPPYTANGGLLAEVGQGWYSPESQRGETWRWAKNPAEVEIYLYNLGPTAQAAELQFSIYSFQTERDIVTRLNGQRLESYNPGPERLPLKFKLTLPPGRNVFTIGSSQPGLSVADFGFKNDSRVLSFGMLEVRLEPAR